MSIRRAPIPTLFPYTTLFRSETVCRGVQPLPVSLPITPRAAPGWVPVPVILAIGAEAHVLGEAVELSRAGSVRLVRSEEHTSELQSLRHLVCRLLLEKKNNLR